MAFSFTIIEFMLHLICGRLQTHKKTQTHNAHYSDKNLTHFN